jgi:hypothetical protein
LEDPRVDGRILKCISSSDGNDVDWINLAKDMNRWWGVVKTAMNFGVQ